MINTKDNLLKLYYSLLRIRMIEEKIAELYHQQEMRCPVHLSIGEEACAVAVCNALKKSDYVISNHRSHGHYLAKGGNLKKMLAEIYGKSTGCSKGMGGSMHLVDLKAGFLGATPIVANSIPIAVGTALKTKLKKQNNISVAFFGDAAVEEGVFHESANFASLHNLPVLFVCENNLYSVYTHLKQRQPNRPIYKLAQAHKIKSNRFDGNDLFGLYKNISAIVSEMRKTKKPRFVEITTYRWREHCGPNYDNNIGYRTEKEFLNWKKKDSLTRARARLYNLGILTKEGETRLINKIKTEIDEAVNFAKSSPFPKKEQLGKYLYAD